MTEPVHVHKQGQLVIKGVMGGRWNVFLNGKRINRHTLVDNGFFSYNEAMKWCEKEYKELLIIVKTKIYDDDCDKYYNGLV
jgi:hypothetical protein